jgi:hypothetical protein
MQYIAAQKLDGWQLGYGLPFSLDPIFTSQFWGSASACSHIGMMSRLADLRVGLNETLGASLKRQDDTIVRKFGAIDGEAKRLSPS